MKSRMQVGEVMFFCGKAGGVHVTDEHDVAADEHMHAMMVQHFERNGEWPKLDQCVDWMEEGREASRRRMTVRESGEVDAAIALLKRHGFRVRGPSERWTET